MDSRVRILVSYIACAVVSSVGTYHVTKKHFLKIADIEVASVKESFRRAQSEMNEKLCNKPDISTYSSVLEKVHEEADRFDEKPALEEDSGSDQETWRPITAVDFLEQNGFSKLDVTMYSDGTFADSENEEVDMDSLVGIGASSLSMYSENDELYFRNLIAKRDVAVAKENRTFEEAIAGY